MTTTEDALAPLALLPGVAESVDATRAAMDALLREPALRRRRGEVRASARVHSAWASATLAGASVALDAFHPPFAEDEGGRLAGAALSAASEVGGLASTWRSAPLQVIARLHSVAAVQIASSNMLGRPRSTPGVGERLTALADAAASTSVSGVVLSGVVHAELMTLQPFGTVDGIVARAASRVVLVQTGVDPDALVVPEMGIVELGEPEYRQALDGFSGGTSEGLAHWLTFHAAAVQRGAAFARTLCR